MDDRIGGPANVRRPGSPAPMVEPRKPEPCADLLFIRGDFFATASRDDFAVFPRGTVPIFQPGSYRVPRAFSRARNRRDRPAPGRDIARNISVAFLRRSRSATSEASEASERASERGAPCIRVLTQSLSRNFSGRQGRIYQPRCPVLCSVSASLPMRTSMVVFCPRRCG